ncbi:MAG TPA: heavy-metal-associated domain-containing protein [Candidatus Fimimonas merdipullorum]|uniref:Heavy-metal-associated domain-containing protein n=1 Tax=Candidatus Fimimonas merdipullorum TaxID=2840822 RepID=A0A9D1MYF3_9BACT|nr:heavy-metal-associated domain-containing protein [Candidatus Fimimonas merdipullorum]
MKKVYKITDIDCANCAAKLERALAKVEGVQNVSISFLSQRLALEAEDGRFDEVFDNVVKVCRRVEPDCKIAR